MLRLPVELFLALRYLRPKRTYVSIITLIAVIGVILGVAVLIIVISVMTGFDRQLHAKILGLYPHLRVTMAQNTLRNYTALMRVVAANPEVRGVSPFVMGPVLVETQPTSSGPGQAPSTNSTSAKVMAPYLRGIDPQLESKVSVLPESLRRGKFDLTDNGLLVGAELADVLDLKVGDTLCIYSTRNLKKMRDSRDRKEDEVILPDEFEVRGIFDVGYYEYNLSVIVTSLANAQYLYDLGGDVHGLHVILKDPFRASAVRAQLRAQLGPDVAVRTWLEENSGILNALVVEKNVMFYILFFIVLVAAFGITSALITFAVQKTREIGTLKALGATNGQVMGLFLGQSIAVGSAGVAGGLGLGLLGLHYRNEFLHFLNRMTGFELFPASIYGFSELPALTVPHDIFIICGVSIILCTLAGLVPAWNASRLHPVEALRHE